MRCSLGLLDLAGSKGKKRKFAWSAESETVGLNGVDPGASQGSGEHPTPEEVARAGV